MDKLRELTGLVQRLGAGGGIGAEDNSRRNKDLLDELPLTKRFLDQLPRKQIEQTAKENEKKAAEALCLLQRVDELVESHTSTAASLTTFLTQLSTIPSSLAQANELAQSIHTQLTTLSALISTEESHLESSTLTALQYSEDQKFASYAADRRAALERKKEEYARQLDDFRRERLGLISAGSGGDGMFVRSKAGSKKPKGAKGHSPSPSLGGASRTSAPSMGLGTAGNVNYSTPALGLEHVTLAPDHHSGAGGELEDFFSSDEQEKESGQSLLTTVPQPLAHTTLRPKTVPPITSLDRHYPPPMSPPTIPRPQTPLKSPPPPPQAGIHSPRRKASAAIPPPAPPAPPPPGIIAADEDFDVDSEVFAGLYAKGNGKKGKKKKK